MKSEVYEVLNIQPMNCMKMHYTISMNDDSCNKLVECNDACSQIPGDFCMHCTAFGCETRAKTCMDEKVIRFRKQNATLATKLPISVILLV